MTLVLSPEPLGAAMAGPAIRATELARAVGGEAVFSTRTPPATCARGRRRPASSSPSRRGRSPPARCGARARG